MGDDFHPAGYTGDINRDRVSDGEAESKEGKQL